jgi:hypothetical protein
MKFPCLSIIVLIALAAGCNSGPRLLGFHGEVSYQGKPIEKGTIEFIPTDNTRGPSVGGPITNGRYDVLAARGAREGGTYQVRITALKKTGKKIPNIIDPKGPPMELEDNFIPLKYNRASSLKVTVTPETVGRPLNFQLQ